MSKDAIVAAVKAAILGVGGLLVALGFATADDISQIAENVSAIVGSAMMLMVIVWPIAKKIYDFIKSKFGAPQ